MLFKSGIAIVHVMAGIYDMPKLFVHYLEHRRWMCAEVYIVNTTSGLTTKAPQRPCNSPFNTKVCNNSIQE